MHILIIDDHEIVRDGIKTLIEQEYGWHVSYAVSSLDALPSFATLDDIDVAILDISLAQESGFDTLVKIKKDAPFIKCLMLSMYDHVGYISKALELGADLRDRLVPGDGLVAVAGPLERLVQARAIRVGAGGGQITEVAGALGVGGVAAEGGDAATLDVGFDTAHAFTDAAVAGQGRGHGRRIYSEPRIPAATRASSLRVEGNGAS